MAFRVGLLFYSAPAQPSDSSRVAALLEKIDAKSSSVRGHQRLTLVPFVRDASMVAFAQSVAGVRYQTEAAAFDAAGVAFGTLDAFANRRHPAFDAETDFDLGMSVLLWRCAAVVIVCRDAAEAEEARERLAAYESTHAFFAILPLQGGRVDFVEVNPRQEPKDEPSWLLAVTETWEAENTGLPPEPAGKQTVMGLLFPVFNSALIGRRSETIKKSRPTREERCRAGMGLSQEANKKLNELDRASLDALLGVVCPYFAGHDDLGKHYSNVFRTTCFLVPLLIIVSTILAVAAAIDNTRHTVWHIVEFLLLLVAAFLFFRTRVFKHHRKWVENRLIAELLRPTLLNAIFHTIPRLNPPAEEPSLWFDRSQLLLRHLRSLPPLAFTTPANELLSARVSAIHDFSNYQAKWHRDFAAQHRDAEKWLTRISAYAFVITLVLCVVQLLISYGVSVMQGYLGETPRHLETVTVVAHTLAHGLMMLTLISAGCAFVILLLLHQLGFDAIAERSSNAAEHFETLQQSIKRGGHIADARQVYAWADECAGAILTEQHSWYRQIPLIRMHL
jgi:uncharacterized membrane protein YhdT